jgi:hypothetical protein
VQPLGAITPDSMPAHLLNRSVGLRELASCNVRYEMQRHLCSAAGIYMSAWKRVRSSASMKKCK